LILGVLLLRGGRGGKGGGQGGKEGKGGKEGREGEGKGRGEKDPLDLLPRKTFPSYATVCVVDSR